MIKSDYYGRIEGWTPIKNKPFPYFISIGVKACSKCGKLYFDTWSNFCQLDGKFLIMTDILDKDHRQLLGLEEESAYQKLRKKKQGESEPIKKKITKGVLRVLRNRNHIDARTGIAMTVCGKHCWHNEEGNFRMKRDVDEK